MEIKRVMAHAVNCHGRTIGDSEIDDVFDKLLGAPDCGLVRRVGHVGAETNNIEHQNSDNLQTNNLKVIFYTFTFFSSTTLH
jgi:hypothetical protein